MANSTVRLSQKEQWRTILEGQKVHAKKEYSVNLKRRRKLLSQLKSMLMNHEEAWLEALRADLGKPSVEAYASELAVLYNEIDYVDKHLAKWMRPKRLTRLLPGGLEKVKIERQGYGTVLIISPWNYPLNLSLMPMIGAFAAGNSCFLKPSELARTTAQLLEELLSEYFTPEEVTVVQGDAFVAENLLKLPWDMIFFTGSKRVGTIVHQAAARHQIPIILELGGKNPCIVDATGVSPTTARRIVWGKFLNAGQTCIAPDTIYVHQSMYQPFLTMLREQIKLFYGMNPAKSSDYGRIAHPGHYNKLIGYLQEGTIWHGGRIDASQNYIEPTLLTDIPLNSELRQAEIFGPILPVIPYSDLDALMHQLEEGPDPLVTYMFSEDRTSIQQLKKTQRTGAISVNQVIRHAANPRIPFGGVGTSGFGRYHGQASIEAFSYEKVYYKEHSIFEMKNQYPPYRPHVLPILRKLRRWLF